MREESIATKVYQTMNAQYNLPSAVKKAAVITLTDRDVVVYNDPSAATSQQFYMPRSATAGSQES